MDPNDNNEVMGSGEMQRKHDLYPENRRPIKLDVNNVPLPVRKLTPLAERWGEPDDIIRDDMVRQASYTDRSELIAAVFANEEHLEAWLAGPASHQLPYSDEYNAFTAMFMAADLARILNRR